MHVFNYSFTLAKLVLCMVKSRNNNMKALNGHARAESGLKHLEPSH